MKRWAKAEIAEVKRRVEAGESDATIAAAMNITAYSIRYIRSAVLGIKHAAKRHLPIDDDLRKIWESGERPTDAELAERLNASVSTIKKHRTALGLRHNREWSTAEISLLRVMWNDGQSDREYIRAYRAKWPERVPPSLAQVRERRYRSGLSRRALGDYSTRTLIEELHRRGKSAERLGALTIAELVIELEKRGRTVTISTAKKSGSGRRRLGET